MKCSIIKQIVTDNKVIIHVVLDRATHFWHSEWVPRSWTLHSLSYSVSKDAAMTRESTVFEALRVLSVLLITVFTQMPVAPKHTAAMQGFFKTGS